MPHDHPPAPAADLGPVFVWAIGLNTLFVAIEAGAGLLSGSLALLADAAHNLTDVAGLVVAWVATILARRAGSDRHTWGLGRATIMAALFNATAILAGVAFVIWEATQRFYSDIDVPGGTIFWVALIGIAVNTGTALLFLQTSKSDLNARGAFLHMAADAAVSGAVVIAAAGIMLTGYHWIDPAIAIAVSLLIAFTAAGLFRAALHLNLDGVPQGLDRPKVEQWLRNRPGVSDIHDLHIWALSTARSALTVHLVWNGDDADAFLDDLARDLSHDFAITHTTVQLEGTECRLAKACSGG